MKGRLRQSHLVNQIGAIGAMPTPAEQPETGAMPGAMPQLTVSDALRPAENPRDFAKC